MSPAERENQRPSDILQLQVTAKLATEGVEGHDDVYYAYFLYFFSQKRFILNLLFYSLTKWLSDIIL